mmetsp:Transcript_17386/g.43271  ORF Transcript_17386/g.43271 Transcript_17386/m.43271 type:complete len:201 (-) Transcript_17386:2796-3398(-)
MVRRHGQRGRGLERSKRGSSTSRRRAERRAHVGQPKFHAVRIPRNQNQRGRVYDEEDDSCDDHQHCDYPVPCLRGGREVVCGEWASGPDVFYGDDPLLSPTLVHPVRPAVFHQADDRPEDQLGHEQDTPGKGEQPVHPVRIGPAAQVRRRAQAVHHVTAGHATVSLVSTDLLHRSDAAVRSGQIHAGEQLRAAKVHQGLG